MHTEATTPCPAAGRASSADAHSPAPPSIACGAALPPLDTPSLAHAFAATARAHPARTAAIDGGRRLDYAALDRASDALADALAATGAAHGDRIGLRLDRSLEAVVATVAILKCGAACVPFDPAAPAARHAAQARSAGLRALVLAPGTPPPDGFAGPCLSVDIAGGAAVDGAGRPRPLPALAPDDIAYVIHTSGSTGEPKGVRLTHRGLLDLFRGLDPVPVSPGDTVHHGMSIAFDGAVFELWLALRNGAALSILPPGASAGALCDLAERNGVDTMLLTTGLFNTLTDDALRRLARVRTMLVGGDVLAPRAAARFLAAGGRLVNGYGPTEIAVFSHMHALRVDDAGGDAIPVGRPLPGTRAYVLDADRQPVPVGAEGELYIGGSGVAAGYLADPALTAARFLPDPFAGGDARMYRSGDLVRQREDGALAFVGRIDTQVKINGFRVELGEIEHALCDSDGLDAACVVQAKSADGRSQLHAFAVRGARASLDEDALLARLRERLPAYMLPRTLRLLPALPLTINGKVDRRALLALCEDAAPAAAAVDPAAGDDGLAPLLAMLADCLGVPALARDDNFYAVGGDSLAAMRFCALLEETRGVALPMTALFEADTLGEALADVRRAAAPAATA